jgi:hypothetical protein
MNRENARHYERKGFIERVRHATRTILEEVIELTEGRRPLSAPTERVWSEETNMDSIFASLPRLNSIIV